MRIINTFEKIPTCFTNHVFDLNAWRKYTKELSDELSEKCEKGAKKYDFDHDVLPVINNIFDYSAKYLFILLNNSII